MYSLSLSLSLSVSLSLTHSLTHTHTQGSQVVEGGNTHTRKHTYTHTHKHTDSLREFSSTVAVGINEGAKVWAACSVSILNHLAAVCVCVCVCVCVRVQRAYLRSTHISIKRDLQRALQHWNT